MAIMFVICLLRIPKYRMFQVQVYQSHLVLLKLAGDEQFLLQPLHLQSFKCTYNTNDLLVSIRSLSRAR